MRRTSIIGNRYGKLTVKEMVYNVKKFDKSQARTYCVCQCDCGKEIVADAYKLKSGVKQSCGCDTPEKRSKACRYNLEGQAFNRLTVIETMYGSKVRCKCECGNEVIVSTTDLISGHTQSCGCLQKERASECNTKDYRGVVSRYGVKLIKRYVKNAKGQWLWECECGLCSKRFYALPAHVLNGHITSCGCRRMSSREQLIENILIRENVSYRKQYSIPECKDKQVLLFDFALFDGEKMSALIEYDGRQHFEAIEFYGGKVQFDKTVRRDDIKNQYCIENGINLYRLPYTMTDEEIESKITSIIYP